MDVSMWQRIDMIMQIIHITNVLQYHFKTYINIKPLLTIFKQNT